MVVQAIRGHRICAHIIAKCLRYRVFLRLPFRQIVVGVHAVGDEDEIGEKIRSYAATLGIRSMTCRGRDRLVLPQTPYGRKRSPSGHRNAQILHLSWKSEIIVSHLICKLG